jgi:uncharacterized protein YsxB (DUF464 family)
MIEVLLYGKNTNVIEKFEVVGHAEYDEPGRDLVCCAVSAIVQTAVLGLLDVANIPVVWEQKKGYLLCVLPRNMPRQDRVHANIIINTMIKGLKSIRESYGNEYISIRRVS